MRHIHSLIRKLDSDSISGVVGGLIDNFINNSSTPNDRFSSPVWKAVDGSIPKNNWGSFGTIIADRGAQYLMNKFLDLTTEDKPNAAIPVPRTLSPNTVYTEPLNRTNSGVPATTGTVVDYSPTLSPSSVKMVGVKQRVRRVVKRKTRKSVNEVLAPKPKPKIKRRRYKAEV